MDKIGYLYESPTEIRIADKLPLLCEKGLKLIVIKDCYDESYLYELTHYWRGGLRELKLKEGDIVEVIGCWKNFYGSYIKCKFNNVIYDIKPTNLSFSFDIN